MFGSAPADRYLPYAIPTVGRGSRILYLKRLSACYVARQPLCVGRRAGITGCAGAAARFDITEEGLRYLRQWVNGPAFVGG